MLKRETRPMTAEERAEFEKIAAGLRVSFDPRKHAAGAVVLAGVFALLGFLLGTLIATILYFLSKVLPFLVPLTQPHVVRAFIIWGAVAGGTGMPILVIFLARHGMGLQRKKIEKDIESGMLEVIEATSGAAVHEDLNGEEQLFFLEVGDGKVLFLCGEYLADPMMAGTFPNTHFRIKRGTHSSVILGMECLGNPFKAQKADLDLDLDDCCFPIDGDVLDARLATLDEDLKKRRQEHEKKGGSHDRLPPD